MIEQIEMVPFLDALIEAKASYGLSAQVLEEINLIDPENALDILKENVDEQASKNAHQF